MYISGDWKEYIAVENGDYVMEDNEGVPRISLKLTLLKTYEDEEEYLSGAFKLIAINSGGASLGRKFWVDSSSKNKFNDEGGVSETVRNEQ